MTLYDDADALRNELTWIGSPKILQAAKALIDSVDELYEGTPAQRIGKILRDENGLSLTPAAIDVLVSVLATIDSLDETWGEKKLPGVPSINDYAANVIEVLRRRYATSLRSQL